MRGWMLRALWPIAGILVQLLLADTAAACVAVVDDKGRRSTPVVDPSGLMFIGKLVGVRPPDIGEIDQLRARWDSTPSRRAASDQKVIESFSRSNRIAEFAVQQDHGTAEQSNRIVWFENNGVCRGPFNEGLPLDIGQTAVVFVTVVEGVPTGWIPNLVSVERIGSKQPLDIMRQLTEQSDRCPEPNPPYRYTLETTYLRAPESGFGRGCVAEMR
jgi:hypothetical protein